MMVRQYTTEQEMAFANQIKDILLEALETEKLLIEPAEDIAGRYAVVIHDKSFLGRTWDRLRGTTDNDSTRITVVKGVFEESDNEADKNTLLQQAIIKGRQDGLSIIKAVISEEN